MRIGNSKGKREKEIREARRPLGACMYIHFQSKEGFFETVILIHQSNSVVVLINNKCKYSIQSSVSNTLLVASSPEE